MSEQPRICKQLLLLVGSNPLPNLLAVRILKPESICLFYSPETKLVKDYLLETLKAKVGEENLNEKCIANATDSSAVRQAFKLISKDSHLHYTGGTKIMAAHARMAFRDAGGKDEQASYLDERNAVLRFDNGYEIPLSKQHLELTIDEILGLHGITRPSKGEPPKPEPTEQDVRRIVDGSMKAPDLAGKLYTLHLEEGKPRSFSKAKREPVKLEDFVSDLSIQQLPENAWTENTYKKWCDFLGGGWLERWCGDLVQDVVKESEVHVSVDCNRSNGRQFEIDVALVRGHRLYVISCTTDTKIGLCKSKLFEVAMRARQLGGDLARCALVCLLHGSDKKGPFVDQLRSDVEDIWDAPNTPKVFGLDDLKEWCGIQGEPNVGTLQQWLES
jgi:hypothetical protein